MIWPSSGLPGALPVCLDDKEQAGSRLAHHTVILWDDPHVCRLLADRLVSSCLSCCFRCHPDDPEHKISACHEACPRLLPCGHICTAECGDHPCPPCREVVQKELPCGHAQEMRCHAARRATQAQCLKKVEVTMPVCGHTVTVRCGDAARVGAGPSIALSRAGMLRCMLEDLGLGRVKGDLFACKSSDVHPLALAAKAGSADLAMLNHLTYEVRF